jgi:hypothetical protein
MAAVFGALLPAELIARPDKACFDEVFFNEHSRAFAAGWTGGGVPHHVVDPSALRKHWLTGDPRAQSFSLLQAAWLSADRGQQPLGAGLERVPAPRAGEAQHRQ